MLSTHGEVSIRNLNKILICSLIALLNVFLVTGESGTSIKEVLVMLTISLFFMYISQIDNLLKFKKDIFHTIEVNFLIIVLSTLLYLKIESIHPRLHPYFNEVTANIRMSIIASITLGILFEKRNISLFSKNKIDPVIANIDYNTCKNIAIILIGILISTLITNGYLIGI